VGVPSPEEAEARSELTRNLNGIEEFLFVRKTGHCEWYASASAVLLRLSGVPTRLVAGFRLSKGQVGGVLSVRSSDAHAWVEAWSPERGWIPFDPTPRVMSSSPFEVFSDAYDWLSAYWFKWVVSYDMGDFTSEVAKSVRENLSLSRLQEASLESIANQKGLIVGALFGALALGGAVLLVLRIWFPQFFSIRWRVHEGPPVLRRERLRMERMLRRAQIPAEEFEQTRHLVYRARGAQAGDLFTEWLGTYQSARFGRTTTPLDDTARVLNEKYLRFKRSVTN
jgi:hypothetical protein